MTAFTRVTDDVDDVLAAHVNQLIDGIQQMPGPDAWMENGKIVPSVTSNNLTLALKTLAGNDPSATDFVSVRIGDTVRTITTALSIVLNASTAWFGLTTAFAATEVDLFAYLVWNTNLTPDGFSLLVSRIPGGRLYSDFSATSTNERYGATTGTAPAATDVCINIGRFAATLGASASYNWSVPTYTNINLIQGPIFETRWLTWTPQWSNLTIGTGPTNMSRYQLRRATCFYHLSYKLGTGGAVTGVVNASLPIGISAAMGSASLIIGAGNLLDSSASTSYGAQPLGAAGGGVVYPIAMTQISTTYVGQAFLGATVPFTWAVNDEIMFSGVYAH